MYKLTSMEIAELSNQIRDDINEASVALLDEGKERSHLGASIIGRECSREIWYGWRWVKREVFDGRMLRLFNRGHEEEARIIRWMRAAGWEVWETDPATGEQFRIAGVNGHFGGSLDGIGRNKKYFDFPVLLEFKTHNYKSFSHLSDKGVVVGKPVHYAQMCKYGKEYNLHYALYFPVNKNDDDIKPEIVELNHSIGADLERKAQDIIEAAKPPPRISDQPTYFTCKFCSKFGVCHKEESYDVNCRSCSYARPADNGEWYCGYFSNNIPKDFIPVGCSNHKEVGR